MTWCFGKIVRVAENFDITDLFSQNLYLYYHIIIRVPLGCFKKYKSAEILPPIVSTWLRIKMKKRKGEKSWTMNGILETIQETPRNSRNKRKDRS